MNSRWKGRAVIRRALCLRPTSISARHDRLNANTFAVIRAGFLDFKFCQLAAGEDYPFTFERHAIDAHVDRKSAAP